MNTESIKENIRKSGLPLIISSYFSSSFIAIGTILSNYFNIYITIYLFSLNMLAFIYIIHLLIYKKNTLSYTKRTNKPKKKKEKLKHKRM